MNNYVFGPTIKKLREAAGMTQKDLALKLGISDKTISKWETAKGLPDITLIEPLARALNITVSELLSGDQVQNQNRSANMLRSKIYVCPVCGNVIHTTGEAVISCCGITLPAAEAETADDSDGHIMQCEKIEDEYYISIDHDMTKEHYISFIAYVTDSKFEMVKLYPEGNAEARFFIRGRGLLYCYCNHHGLFRQKI